MFSVYEDLKDIMIDMIETYDTYATSTDRDDKELSHRLNSVIEVLARLIDQTESKLFRKYYNQNANRSTIPIEVIRDYLKEIQIDISVSALRKRVTRGKKDGSFTKVSRLNP